MSRTKFRPIVATLILVVIGIVQVAKADYTVFDRGEWPKNWPAELEPLRTQATTYIGPIDQTRYLIPFTNKEDFETAWPQLLKIKTKGAAIVLVKGPMTGFFTVKPAGVLIVESPAQSKRSRISASPASSVKAQVSEPSTTRVITLVVDGKIVDLNRIRFPKDTTIVDKRFPTKN